MQVSPVYVAEVIDGFCSWVQEFDELASETSYNLLQDYIATWLMNSRWATEVTGGKYANYLLAVLIITDGYSKNPSMLDYKPLLSDERRERRVQGLIDLHATTAMYFDQYRYQQEVFRQLRGLDEYEC